MAVGVEADRLWQMRTLIVPCPSRSTCPSISLKKRKNRWKKWTHKVSEKQPSKSGWALWLSGPSGDLHTFLWPASCSHLGSRTFVWPQSAWGPTWIHPIALIIPHAPLQKETPLAELCGWVHSLRDERTPISQGNSPGKGQLWVIRSKYTAVEGGHPKASITVIDFYMTFNLSTIKFIYILIPHLFIELLIYYVLSPKLLLRTDSWRGKPMSSELRKCVGKVAFIII